MCKAFGDEILKEHRASATDPWSIADRDLRGSIYPQDHFVSRRVETRPNTAICRNSLCSQKRIAAYEQTLTEHTDPPLAVLRIPNVSLEVPVLEGTDDLILNRGVGHIAGTVQPGEDGNIGIAGHRDGFFRVLKDVG